ncbi:hypothetical protein HIM_03165 [Hirsutella minnesotensis 3608]|nr:hypothetical protein HIM_03165 [Hirsutella minnesotensis 3608]
MHWINQMPRNLQAFGMCSKDAATVLRLADGTRINAQSGFAGSWPGGGGSQTCETAGEASNQPGLGDEREKRPDLRTARHERRSNPPRLICKKTTRTFEPAAATDVSPSFRDTRASRPLNLPISPDRSGLRLALALTLADPDALAAASLARARQPQLDALDAVVALAKVRVVPGAQAPPRDALLERHLAAAKVADGDVADVLAHGPLSAAPPLVYELVPLLGHPPIDSGLLGGETADNVCGWQPALRWLCWEAVRGEATMSN